MDTTTIANVDTRTACDATPAALRRSATTWQRSHASTSGRIAGGVRLDALAGRVRGAAAPAFRGVDEPVSVVLDTRSTVPSPGTTPTSPPV